MHISERASQVMLVVKKLPDNAEDVGSIPGLGRFPGREHGIPLLLTIFTSHQVKQLLNGRGHLWTCDQRILRYQVVLMENPGLTISPCEVFNPASLLPAPKGSLFFHSCLETLDHWTKPREGLSEDPLTSPEEI